MANPEALALLRIARRELKAASLLQDPAAPEANWGFQIQQAVEKALKAWLSASIASNDGLDVADLLVRGVDEEVVKALKKRAGSHGHSAEAEHRAILAAALLTPRRRPLAQLLASMPDVGRDDDFERREYEGVAADVLG